MAIRDRSHRRNHHYIMHIHILASEIPTTYYHNLSERVYHGLPCMAWRTSPSSPFERKMRISVRMAAMIIFSHAYRAIWIVRINTYPTTPYIAWLLIATTDFHGLPCHASLKKKSQPCCLRGVGDETCASDETCHTSHVTWGRAGGSSVAVPRPKPEEPPNAPPT